MKHFANIFLIAIVIGCAGTPDESAPIDTQQPANTTKPDTAVADSPQSTLADTVYTEVYWWDSLISDNKALRIQAMNKYRAIRSKNKKRDFENGEMISGYLKTFFSSHPVDFLEVYSDMKHTERKMVQEDIASTFYVAGEEFKSYLDEYFSNIQNSCNNCTHDQKAFLKDIRQNIEAYVKKKVEDGKVQKG